MPAYVYQCKACRARFELTHPVNGCALTHLCPECGSPRTHRVPQDVQVRWDGLRPSQGSLSPRMRNLVDESNRRRRVDKYRKEKRSFEWE